MLAKYFFVKSQKVFASAILGYNTAVYSFLKHNKIA